MQIPSLSFDSHQSTETSLDGNTDRLTRTSLSFDSHQSTETLGAEQQQLGDAFFSIFRLASEY